MSFGAIADDYNRFRPGPPTAAVNWLLPPGCQVAVDVAAGTGLLTRALAGRVGQVIAVEPDGRMASVLDEHSPGVHVVQGRGEAIPLRAGTVGCLLISSAWHWLEPDQATREIGRVLTDGGRFGIIWTSRDREVEWVRELDWIRRPGRLPASADRDRRHLDRPQAFRPWHRTVALPDGAPFDNVETASFSFTRPMAVGDVVEQVGTYSDLITASPRDRAAGLARTRKLLSQRFPGAAEIDVPMRSRCWRADRTSRSG
jgi:SAM-dependent methyltransferase